MKKLKLHTLDNITSNIDKICSVFPHCITETIDKTTGVARRSIDFDKLRLELENDIVDGQHERYQLDWPGKRLALLSTNVVIQKALRPIRSQSVNFDNSKNIFVEGDNLDALKLLQESYLGKVSFIYIDPPYNTGNDFIYADDFSETSEEFKVRSQQVSAQGDRLVQNLETNGRFHSDWLSMMYPRLRLARTLLREEGFIAISISDKEIGNLKVLMDEIMGGDSFVECFIWESIFRPSNMSKSVRKNAEYILLYVKNKDADFELIERFQDPQGDASLTQNNNKPRVLKFPANTVECTIPDGKYSKSVNGEITIVEDFIVQNGRNATDFIAEGKFKWSQEYLEAEIAKGVTLKIKSESLIPYYRKTYQKTALRPTKIIPNDLVKDVLAANAEIQAIFSKQVFNYPKPTSLISYLIKTLQIPKDGLILDFFAGSGTTGDAVMRTNAEENANRRFILVQLPELVEGGEFATIAEITKERIRRVGKKLKEDNATNLHNQDTGFRLFQIDSPTITDNTKTPDETIQDDLISLADNIKPDRSSEDLLFQVLVDWGLDLALPISCETIAGKKVHFIDGNSVAACFEKQITEDLVREIAKRKPLRAVFRDDSYQNDSLKINVDQIFKHHSPETDVKAI
jgi:adenine-specific DNA-methyltransferase